MVRCLLLNQEFTDPERLREALLAVDWRARVREERPESEFFVLTDNYVDVYVNELFSPSAGAAKRRATGSAAEKHSPQKRQAHTLEARLAQLRRERERKAERERQAARENDREEHERLEREMAETENQRLRIEAAQHEQFARERWERQRERLRAREQQLSQGSGNDDMRELATMFQQLCQQQARSHQ